MKPRVCLAARLAAMLALLPASAMAADSVGQGAVGRDSISPSLPSRGGPASPTPRKDAVKPAPKDGVTKNARRDAITKEPLRKDSVPHKKPGSS